MLTVAETARRKARRGMKVQGFPTVSSGMTVGLLGGSFDPAHAGHVHITHQALRRFRFDRIWWLVSPGNPLKTQQPAPLDRRMAAAHAIMQHPRVIITDIETRLGTRYTADTLRQLQVIYPHVRFTWLMGADNLAHFHRWQEWNWIVQNVPIGITSRPGDHVQAGHAKMAEKYARYRIPATAAKILPLQDAPAWCLLDGPVVDISSTEIRASGQWKR